MSELQPYEGEKAAFFTELEKMRPDLVYQETWTSQQKDEAAQLVEPNHGKLGMLSLIPMMCEGIACPYARVMPLIHSGGPTNKPCPVELAAVREFFMDYVRELDVDVERMVEVSIVRDLVDQEIQLMRKSIRMGQEDFIQENVAGLDSEGNVVLKKELHQAVDYEDRILRRKERLRNQILATREAKAKVGQTTKDSAQIIANILDDARRIERAREQKLRQKLGMNYIEAEVIEDDDEDV